MYLFYDTETTGVDKKSAHIVQLAALLTFPDGRKAGSFDLILQCPIPIPPKCTSIHGISDEMCATLGVQPAGAYDLFGAFCQRAQVAVAYNESFDAPLIQANMQRVEGAAYEDPFEGVTRVCAMQMATSVLGRQRKLIEAHQALLGRGFEGAHDAMADVIAAKDVFFAALARKKADREAAEARLKGR